VPGLRRREFTKQVTAAGFQLKGSGWYATDFRGGASGAPAADKAASDKPADKAADKPADGGARRKPSPRPRATAAPAPTKPDAPSASA
jgi:hypothetical protein